MRTPSIWKTAFLTPSVIWMVVAAGTVTILGAIAAQFALTPQNPKETPWGEPFVRPRSWGCGGDGHLGLMTSKVLDQSVDMTRFWVRRRGESEAELRAMVNRKPIVRRERSAPGHPVEYESRFTVPFSFEAITVRSLGSNRCIALGLDGEVDVLEQWQITWPTGAWIADVGLDGEMTLEPKGGKFIPPEFRTEEPQVTKREIFRGRYMGFLLDAVPMIGSDHKVLVTRLHAHGTFVSVFDYVAGTWVDVASSRAIPDIGPLDTFVDVRQTHEGEIVYQVVDDAMVWAMNTGDLVLLDTAPYGSIDSVEFFPVPDTIDKSRFRYRAPMRQDFDRFK